MNDAKWDRLALVVDDEAFARLHAVQILLDEGFLVLEASDTAEGMAILQCERDVSLVLTDISMPGDLDGLYLARQVRQHRPNVRMIIASGWPPADEHLPAGATFLAKPYTAHALIEAVRGGSPDVPLPGAARAA